MLIMCLCRSLFSIISWVFWASFCRFISGCYFVFFFSFHANTTSCGTFLSVMLWLNQADMEYYPVYKSKRTERRRRRRVIVSGCKLATRVNGCGIQNWPLSIAPRENKNSAYAKFGGEKQRLLWYFPKWPILFLFYRRQEILHFQQPKRSNSHVFLLQFNHSVKEFERK